MTEETKTDTSTGSTETTLEAAGTGNEQTITESTHDEPSEQKADTDTDDLTDTVDTDTKPKESRAQRRINQLTREKYELRSRVEALENAVKGTTQKQDSQQYYNKPTRDAFPNDDDYIEALTEWKLQSSQMKAREEEYKRQIEQKNVDFQAKENLVAKEIPDYYDVIEDGRDVRINQAAIDAIVDSPLGPHLRYYLAKNPDEAESTLRMKPHEAVKFIGKIESKLEEQLKNKQKQTKTKTSNAPPPVKTPKSTGGNIEFDVNDSKISTAEWMRKRNEMTRRGY